MVRLDFIKYVDVITEYIKATIPDLGFQQEDKVFSAEHEEIQKIFLRYLNLSCTISKVYFLLGEFSPYENQIINFIERLEKLYSKTIHSHILAHAYLLMSNLYVELVI